MKKIKLSDNQLDNVIYHLKRIDIALGIVFAILLAINILLDTFTVTSVYVEGNMHYSAEEIKNFIETGKFGDNSLYLSMKYSGKSITDIPFIESMDVDVIDRHTIKISVYEKALAGYVEYLGTYMYFDKDGVIVESSNMKTEGIPLVTGLKFDHFVMFEALPIENPEIFQTILDVTQMLTKYDIDTDKIRFDEDGDMTLYFDEIKVRMGNCDLLEEKIQRLNSILSQLEGKKGVLAMDNYETGSEKITFTLDK